MTEKAEALTRLYTLLSLPPVLPSAQNIIGAVRYITNSGKIEGNGQITQWL